MLTVTVVGLRRIVWGRPSALRQEEAPYFHVLIDFIRFIGRFLRIGFGRFIVLTRRVGFFDRVWRSAAGAAPAIGAEPGSPRRPRWPERTRHQRQRAW